MSLLKSALLRISQSEVLAERVPRYRFVQAAVRRFMPGEDEEAAIDAARGFKMDGMTAVLSQLGENVTNRTDVDAVQRHYLHVQDRIAQEALDAHISVKLTQLGLDLDADLALAHVKALAAHAAQRRSTVWIDMEASNEVDATIELFRNVIAHHANVGLCLQAYLRRTGDDLEALLPRTTGIRLVKGAYDEPPDRAYRNPRDIDANYLQLAVQLLRAAQARPGPVPPALATHDVPLLQAVLRTVQSEGVPRELAEVQMLYGIRVEDQHALARDHRVRVFICYGTAWFPWFVRRLAERPANLGILVRNVFGG